MSVLENSAVQTKLSDCFSCDSGCSIKKKCCKKYKKKNKQHCKRCPKLV